MLLSDVSQQKKVKYWLNIGTRFANYDKHIIIPSKMRYGCMTRWIVKKSEMESKISTKK